MDAQQFGSFVAQCRKERIMTQADLASIIHVTDKAISRWERGIGFPEIQTLEPLASALNISLLELMKAQKMPADHMAKEEAADAVTDTLNTAMQQQKQERRKIAKTLGILSLMVVCLLFFDLLQWQADTIVFTCIGVFLPLFCIGGSIALLCRGIAKKAKDKPYKQSFVFAFVLFFLLLIFVGLFFLIGAFGIGPVPQ